MSQSTSPDQPLKIIIIDDHELVLDATISALKQQYSNAEMITVQNSRDGLEKIEQWRPDLAIVDLSMPEAIGEIAQTRTGIQLLKTLMERYPRLNIVVQSAHA